MQPPAAVTGRTRLWSGVDLPTANDISETFTASLAAISAFDLSTISKASSRSLVLSVNSLTVAPTPS
jgi:hypothetical protein